jgi:hypothetical protein
VAEGLGHVLLLVVGGEDLLVAVDDVLDARGLEREESRRLAKAENKMQLKFSSQIELK